VTDDLALLVDLLDLEPIEVNIFRGVSPDEDRVRAFGGQVAAQALMAAGRTVAQGRPHSLHSYFLRPGDCTVPILYEVDRIRDGRSFTTRRVVAIQRGEAIFNMSCSFHVDEPGWEHQFAMPDVPDPETLESLASRLEPHSDSFEYWFQRRHPIEQRHIGQPPELSDATREPIQRIWFRADGKLPDDPLLHTCIATYASDLSLFDAILAPHFVRKSWGGLMVMSIDHCMWFHRPFRADEWLLFDMDSPSALGARGLGRGLVYSRQGELVISMVQEGLMRELSPPPAGTDVSGP